MILCQQYELVARIGQGKYGFVSRARHKKLGINVALKSIIDLSAIDTAEGSRAGLNCCSVNSIQTADAHLPKNIDESSLVVKQRRCLYHEARVLATLRHPSLVSLVEICVDDCGQLVLALEDLGSLTLAGLVRYKQRNAPESETTVLCTSMVGCVVNEVASALQYLHTQGYLHRDVKPDNIMIERIQGHCFPNVKLIDLGLAISFSGDQPPNSSESRAGTVAFMAPELMIPDQVYGPEVDVFSLGATVYLCLFGKEPFSEFVSMNGVRNTTAMFGFQCQHMECFDRLDADVKRDLISMLAMQPHNRCSIKQLLQSRWLKLCRIAKSFTRHAASDLPELVKKLHLNETTQRSQRCLQDCSCLCNPIVNGLTCSDKEYSNSFESQGSSSLSFASVLGNPISSDEISNVKRTGGLSDTELDLVRYNDVARSQLSPTSKCEPSYLASSVIPVDNREQDELCHVVGFKDTFCRSISDEACCCRNVYSKEERREASTVEAVAELLHLDTETVLENLKLQPWGEIAGVYNLMRLHKKGDENFSSGFGISWTGHSSGNSL